MITIVVGKSASGKDYLVKRAIKELGMKYIVSFTTRPPRADEVDGIDYNFMTDEEFSSKENEMLETRIYEVDWNGEKSTWKYGSPIVNPDEDNYIAIVDIKGALEYIRFYGVEKLKVVVVCADDSVREKRAENRPSFQRREWERRLVKDNEAFSKEKIESITDNTNSKIINNNTNDEVNINIALEFIASN